MSLCFYQLCKQPMPVRTGRLRVSLEISASLRVMSVTERETVLMVVMKWDPIAVRPIITL